MAELLGTRKVTRDGRWGQVEGRGTPNIYIYIFARKRLKGSVSKSETTRTGWGKEGKKPLYSCMKWPRENQGT